MAISLKDIQRGYHRWAAKPHNAKWVRKIDGTPIANDIVVNISDELRESEEVSSDWFSQIVSFLVKNGMLDEQDEYHISDIMAALQDNYAPDPAPVPAPKPFTFADPNAQLQHERHRAESRREK